MRWIAKCRCGPAGLALPVLPTVPSGSPRRTCSAFAQARRIALEVGVIIDPAPVGRADIGGDPAAALAVEQFLDRAVGGRDHRRSARRHDVDRVVDPAARARLRVKVSLSWAALIPATGMARPDGATTAGGRAPRNVSSISRTLGALPSDAPGWGGRSEDHGEQEGDHDEGDTSGRAERQPAHAGTKRDAARSFRARRCSLRSSEPQATASRRDPVGSDQFEIAAGGGSAMCSPSVIH